MKKPMEGNPKPQISQLVNFRKGYDPRRNLKGRAKKYKSKLFKQGYKNSEIVDAINILISLDEQAIREVSENNDATVLEKIISLAILESIRKKTLYNIETLLTRIYGSPKQEIDQTITVTSFNISLNLNGDIPDKPTT